MDVHAVAPSDWPRFDRHVKKNRVLREIMARQVVEARLGPEASTCSQGAAADAVEVIVETVDAPNAQAILACWGERLARLGRGRLRGDGR